MLHYCKTCYQYFKHEAVFKRHLNMHPRMMGGLKVDMTENNISNNSTSSTEIETYKNGTSTLANIEMVGESPASNSDNSIAKQQNKRKKARRFKCLKCRRFYNRFNDLYKHWCICKGARYSKFAILKKDLDAFDDDNNSLSIMSNAGSSSKRSINTNYLRNQLLLKNVLRTRLDCKQMHVLEENNHNTGKDDAEELLRKYCSRQKNDKYENCYPDGSSMNFELCTVSIKQCPLNIEMDDKDKFVQVKLSFLSN